MKISCNCTHCDVSLNLPAELAGSKARCPRCKKVFLIPKAPSDPDRLPPTEEDVAPVDSPDDPKAAPVAVPITVPMADDDAIPMATPMTADENAGMTEAPVAAAGSSSASDIPTAIPDSVEPLPQSINATPHDAVVRRKPRGLKAIMGTLLGVFALTGCLAILAGLAYWLSLQGPQVGKVIVDIPPEHRADCAMIIDGQAHEINRIGPIELSMSDGSHEIQLRRIGYEEINLALVVSARQKLPVVPKWKLIPPESPEPNPSPPEPAPEVSQELDPVQAALGAPVGEAKE